MRTSSMKTRKFQSFVICLLLQTIFLENTCNGQFHWAMNYRREAQKLRQFLQEIKNAEQSDSGSDPMVRIFLQFYSVSFQDI